MKIGIPKEIKKQENRVSVTPDMVAEFFSNGHTVYVQKNAGFGCGFYDMDYNLAGAVLVDTIEEVFEKSELIIKVKEPQPVEVALLKEHHILFTYLHLAADKQLTTSLVETGCTAIAYETIMVNGKLPLLDPMSEVAGRMSTIVGTYHLAKYLGGRGNLIPGVPGVSPSEVVIIGGGTAGTNAVKMALGLGAKVTLLETNTERMRYLDLVFPEVTCLYSNKFNLEKVLPRADMVIGAVLLPGAAAPKIITRDDLKNMKDGSVIVDISVDQGGCVETTRATTHENPTFVEEGVVHYCVANMPGAYPRTSTLALTGATRKWAMLLANNGVVKSCEKEPDLWNGINCVKGKLTYKYVAEAHGLVSENVKNIF